METNTQLVNTIKPENITNNFIDSLDESEIFLLIEKIISPTRNYKNSEEKEIMQEILNKLTLNDLVNFSTHFSIFSDQNKFEILDFIRHKLTDLKEVKNTHTRYKSITVVMKATRLCNLRCEYCNAWSDDPQKKMPFTTLLAATAEFIAIEGIRHTSFVWHGGESLMPGINFYEKAFFLQRMFNFLFNANKKIDNSFQTNGTLINKKWCDFFKKHKISVGVSLDGPVEIHDSRRKQIDGSGSHEKVKKGMQLLRSENVPHGYLCVVDKTTLKYGANFLLSFFVKSEIQNISLLNAIPSIADPFNDPFAISFHEYTTFLNECAKFLVENPDIKLNIREFESLLSLLNKKQALVCVHTGRCMGGYVTVESNGDVRACDKFVGSDEFLFGNIFEKRCSEILTHSANLNREDEKDIQAIEDMKSCDRFKFCQGGCPNDRRLGEILGQSKDGGKCCGLKSTIDTLSDYIYLKQVNNQPGVIHV